MADNRASNKGLLPPHYLIRRHIFDWLEKGVLKPGDRLPTEAALAKRFDVSRMTVRKALQQLKKDGYIAARQGSGSTVVERPQKKVPETIRIGAIFHSDASGTYGDIPELRETAKECGVNLNIYFYSEYVGKNSINDLMVNLIDGEVDGLLICCRNISNDLIFHYSRFLPLVAVYRDCSENWIPSFFFNWHWFSYELVSLLLKHNCKRLIMLLKDDKSFVHINNQLNDGIHYALRKNEATDIDWETIYLANVKEPGQLEKMHQVYDLLDQDGKVGIISYWQWPLFELANSKYAGRIPEDICLAALIGSDSLREQVNCPIIAHEKNYKALIRAATQKLIAMIRKNDPDEETKAYPFYGKLDENDCC